VVGLTTTTRKKHASVVVLCVQPVSIYWTNDCDRRVSYPLHFVCGTLYRRGGGEVVAAYSTYLCARVYVVCRMSGVCSFFSFSALKGQPTSEVILLVRGSHIRHTTKIYVLIPIAITCTIYQPTRDTNENNEKDAETQARAHTQCARRRREIEID